MKTSDFSKYNNSWFNPGGNSIKRIAWYFVNAIFFNSYLLPTSFPKVLILRFFGAEVGRKVVIKPKVNIKYPWNLKIGDYSWIGERVWIDNLALVKIGDNCCISQSALLFCGNHNYKKETFDLMIAEIKLENGSWVGANTTVCPGVILHENSILSAGATATKSLEVNGIYQGNPAIKIKERLIE